MIVLRNSITTLLCDLRLLLMLPNTSKEFVETLDCSYTKSVLQAHKEYAKR
jgi:hypothetical protein